MRKRACLIATLATLVPLAASAGEPVKVSGRTGNEVEIIGPSNRVVCTLVRGRWDKLPAKGALELPKGTSTVEARLRKPAKASLFSLELIDLADKADVERRIKAFKSSTKWMADRTYGIMFQWGGRGR